ncbi:MAG: hypothetical protein L6R30_01895 [Thermoanaerobaculia bacterium]|nr:hypothetical protein [Thermoanaerobaculia bacterium]
MPDDAIYQAKLAALGFTLVEDSLPMAVREFQGYARLERAAKQTVADGALYSDQLESVALDQALRYSGKSHGQLDATTKDLIDAWGQASLRCPVVIEAWKVKKPAKCGELFARLACTKENLWNWDGLPARAERVFVRDFSGFFQPLDPKGAPVRLPIGRFIDEKGFKGPKTDQVWQTRNELTPESAGLTGFPTPGSSNLTPEQKRQASTFRVIRAVYERECYGYFDALNAYDHGILSAGGFHTTFSSGELAALTAFAQSRNPSLARFHQPWGLDPAVPWGSKGAALFKSGQRKYEGSWHRPSGTAVEAPPAGDYDYYRSWHWFFRIQALTRDPAFGPVDYAFARLRLRNLLDTPFPPQEGIPKRTDGKPVRLGDVFRSELSAANLLRWHVNRPGDVVTGGQVTKGIADAVAAAIPPTGNGGEKPAVETLSDADEKALAVKLREAVPKKHTSIAVDFAALGSFPVRGVPGKPPCWSLLRTWGAGKADIEAARAFLKLGVLRSPGLLLHDNDLPDRPY